MDLSTTCYTSRERIKHSNMIFVELNFTLQMMMMIRYLHMTLMDDYPAGFDTWSVVDQRWLRNSCLLMIRSCGRTVGQLAWDVHRRGQVDLCWFFSHLFVKCPTNPAVFAIVAILFPK